MYFQLLGPPMPQAPAHYRGVYRCGPSYHEALPPSAPANRAWQRYVSELGEKAPTEKIAVELADALAAEGQTIDVVRLDCCTAAPPGAESATAIGFDVALGSWYSLLSWSLHWDEERTKQLPLGPLLALIEAYFRPRLNESGLFGNWLDARRFVDVGQALSLLSPGVWEAPGHEKMEIIRVIAVKVAPLEAGHPVKVGAGVAAAQQALAQGMAAQKGAQV